MADQPSVTHTRGMRADSADISSDAKLASSVSVWHLAQVREGAVLGENVIVARGAYIGPGVKVGANCKIQNYALIYEPASLDDGVFIGPAAILTNDRRPRAINSDGLQKSSRQWEQVGVTINYGASIGARAVCIAPVRIGQWAMVAAGAVVVNDVAPHALVAGTPAVRIGWVSRTGARLVADVSMPTRLVCPDSGAVFIERDGKVQEINS